MLANSSMRSRQFRVFSTSFIFAFSERFALIELFLLVFFNIFIKMLTNMLLHGFCQLISNLKDFMKISMKYRVDIFHFISDSWYILIKYRDIYFHVGSFDGNIDIWWKKTSFFELLVVLRGPPKKVVYKLRSMIFFDKKTIYQRKVWGPPSQHYK